MIFYFSGTGNSRYVAHSLERELGEKTFFMFPPSGDKGKNDGAALPLCPDGDSLGFIFPVYSWGVPPNVVDFITRLPDGFWTDVMVKHIPVWVVMTCGDEVAMAPEMITSVLKKRGVATESIWSVIMPNNYVLLPGFDVDSKELENKKLSECGSRIREVAEGIRSGRKTIDVVRGSLPGLKTSLVYPLFRRWGISPAKWRSTEGCVGCGICARSCPEGNIRIVDGRPVWGKNCCSCLACYHSCPRHAVEYGNATKRKGQYFLDKKRGSVI